MFDSALYAMFARGGSSLLCGKLFRVRHHDKASQLLLDTSRTTRRIFHTRLDALLNPPTLLADNTMSRQRNMLAFAQSGFQFYNTTRILFRDMIIA